MNILVVDDEYQLTDAIIEILKKAGFSASGVYDGEDALRCVEEDKFDAIVLDVMLPKLNGYEVLQKIRERDDYIPVLMLSAKTDTDDKVLGLDYGADDYLAKPFDAKELIARLKAITRRTKETEPLDVVKALDLVLDKSTYTLTCKDESIVLGVKEYDIMELLLSNVGKIIPKETIIEKIWGANYETDYNNVEVYASFLRKKLSKIHSTSKIKSHRGVGYKIEGIE